MKRNRTIASILLAAFVAGAMSIPVIATESTAQTEPVSSVFELEAPPEESADEQVAIPSDEQPATQGQAASKKQSDLPLFVGAGISVLVFGGVVAFCRMKGNR